MPHAISLKVATPAEVALYEDRAKWESYRICALIGGIALAAISIAVGVTSSFYPLTALYITAGSAGGLALICAVLFAKVFPACEERRGYDGVPFITGLEKARFLRDLQENRALTFPRPNEFSLEDVPLHLGMRNHEGKTVLMIVAQTGNLAFIRQFYPKVNPEELYKRDNQGANAIALAAEHTSWSQKGNEVVSYLLAEPCDLALREAIEHLQNRGKNAIANKLNRYFSAHYNPLRQASALKLDVSTFSHMAGFLNSKNIAYAARVCSAWRGFANSQHSGLGPWRQAATAARLIISAKDARSLYLEPSGGSLGWRRAGADPGVTPPVPSAASLNVPVPPTIRVHEKPIGPFLIPATLNGNPLTFQSLLPIFQKATGFPYHIYEDPLKFGGEQNRGLPSWIMAMRVGINILAKHRVRDTVMQYVNSIGGGQWRIATVRETLAIVMLQDKESNPLFPISSSPQLNGVLTSGVIASLSGMGQGTLLCQVQQLQFAERVTIRIANCDEPWDMQFSRREHLLLVRTVG